jgi:hypothetical protein
MQFTHDESSDLAHGNSGFLHAGCNDPDLVVVLIHRSHKFAVIGLQML